MFLLTIALTIACVLLVAVAFYWRFTLGEGERSHAKLRPYILPAAILCVIYLAEIPVALLLAHWRGGSFETEALFYRLTGPYGVAYWIGGIFLLLPLLALLPAIGRRYILVATLALFALVPVWFDQLVILVTSGLQ